MKPSLLLYTLLACCSPVGGRCRVETESGSGSGIGSGPSSLPHSSRIHASRTGPSRASIQRRTTSLSARSEADDAPYLNRTGVQPGQAIAKGTELRILGLGDSITVGFLSNLDGGDGNGYFLRLRDNLSENKVVFAGTETFNGTMKDNYFAAWSGKTIQFIADNMGPSLEQQPNVVLLHAGTNDMNPNKAVATEGNDPSGAAERLGALIDLVVNECPGAVILVAMIINTCDPKQSPRTKEFQALVPDVVAKRRGAGHHVLAADFTGFPTSHLRDCIHPTNEGYQELGDYWYDFLTQVPSEWIGEPVGDDPERADSRGSVTSIRGATMGLMLFALFMVLT